MGRFKTTEERMKKKMEKNPITSAGISALKEEAPKVEYTEEQKALIKQGATEERQRILGAVFTNKEGLTAEYKILIKHSGSLVSGSMAVAYSRAFNDIIKLIIKETSNEKSV